MCCALIYAVIMKLYNLPMQAVRYAFLVCLTLIFVVAVFDFAIFAKKHARLKRMSAHGITDAEQLPERGGAIEADYRAIIVRLLAEQERALNAQSAKIADMTGYYAVWAHQIKTPIAAMRLILQGEDDAHSSELKQELMAVEHYVDMAMGYLRLNSDTTDFVFREYELDDIVRLCVKKFSHQFIRKRLRLRYAPISARVVTDKKWLGFMLEQLISNALKYTGAGEIALSFEDGALIISDTGIGITPEDLPRVFEMGYTGINGRINARASGIGLYLCKRVAIMLGHDLSITSAVGKGTRVYIRFSQNNARRE